MRDPNICEHTEPEPIGRFCKLLKKGARREPCAIVLGRPDDCPLERTMQSGDSSVIQQGDAGER